jgi:hypothetical protein
MKSKICIILIILLSANFGYAQPKLITREELDKRQVRKFVEKFTKSLDETKDLNLTLSKFASKNFKTNLEKLHIDYNDQLKELNTEQQSEFKISMLSLMYSGMIWNGGSYNFIYKENDDENTAVESKEDDSDDDDYVTNMFPPEIIEILKKSQLFCKIFEIDEQASKIEIGSQDFVDSIEILKNANAMLKISIENREPSWEERYAKNIQAARKRFEFYESERCKEDDCYSFPEKTRVYTIAVFPYFLVLARENGKLKLVYMDIYTND